MTEEIAAYRWMRKEAKDIEVVVGQIALLAPWTVVADGARCFQ